MRILYRCDVARSQIPTTTSHQLLSESVQSANNKITSIDIVNLFNVSNALNFFCASCDCEKDKAGFNARMVIVDGNGLGSGLVRELLKESFDPITKESLAASNC